MTHLPDVDPSLAAGEPEEAVRRLLVYARYRMSSLPDDGALRARWSLLEASARSLVDAFEDHHKTPERAE